MKRKDDWASLVPEGMMAAGGGPDGSTAYDQTQQDAGVDPGSAPVDAPAGAAGDAAAPVPDAPAGLLAGMGGGGGTTDDLTGAQLGQLDQGGGSADEAFQQLQAALQDPNTPDDVKAQIEQQLALEAKRQMLGGA